VNILTVLEHDADGVRAAAKALTAPAARLARGLGGASLAVAVGCEKPDASLNKSAAKTLYVAADSATLTLAQAIDLTLAAAKAANAHIILIAETTWGREIAGGVAAGLQAGICTAAHALTVRAGRIEVEASKLGGSVLTTCAAKPDVPLVILVRPNSLRESEPETETSIVPLALPVRARQVVVEERIASGARTVMLEEADVVISGGRGLGGPEPFTTWLADLASACGGAVGASRAVVDAGWAPHAQQVGQTGKTVRPRLYFAVAISGAIQHRVGMQTAGTIIAINKEAKIPLAEIADLLIVGDANVIVPELTRLIRLQKGLA
jgi:electron transfer flavoprotein alpha subunit